MEKKKKEREDRCVRISSSSLAHAPELIHLAVSERTKVFFGGILKEFKMIRDRALCQRGGRGKGSAEGSDLLETPDESAETGPAT